MKLTRSHLLKAGFICILIQLLFYTINAAANPNAPRLGQVSRIKAVFSAELNKLMLSFQRQQKAKKYKVEISSSDGSIFFKTTTSKTSISLNPALFNEGGIYSIGITSLNSPEFQNSKIKTKTFKYTSKVASDELISDFSARNSGGRQGQYYLPKNYRLKNLPLLILFHGSSISGSNVLKLFKTLAREKGFIIAAPDSSNPAGWDVPSDFSSPTEDQLHFYAVLNELLSLTHVNIDTNRVLVAGISAGGAMAGFIGSNDPQFRKIAILHGGIILNELGTNRVPVWLSTGTEDTLRTPAELMGYKSPLEALGFPLVEYHEFPGAHQVLEDEKEELISWWLSQ